MNPRKTEEIEWITNRVVTLQKKLVSADEKFRQIEQQRNKNHEKLCLSIIDVLEFVERLQGESGTVLAEKISKKLANILKNEGITEIAVDKVVPGLVKVVDTSTLSGTQAGTVLEVCRKGYQLGKKVVRPAEVITSIE